MLNLLLSTNLLYHSHFKNEEMGLEKLSKNQEESQGVQFPHFHFSQATKTHVSEQ